MKILKFKTNVEDETMLQSLKSHLDKEKQITDWKVDLKSEEKILSIASNEITSEEITKIIVSAGFKAILVRVQGINGSDI